MHSIRCHIMALLLIASSSLISMEIETNFCRIPESLADSCIRTIKLGIIAHTISSEKLSNLPTELQEKIKAKKVRGGAYKKIAEYIKNNLLLLSHEEKKPAKAMPLLFPKLKQEDFNATDLPDNPWKFKFIPKEQGTGIYDKYDNLVREFPYIKKFYHEKMPQEIIFAKRYYYYTPDAGSTLARVIQDYENKVNITAFDLTLFTRILKDPLLPLLVEGYLARKTDPTNFISSYIAELAKSLEQEQNESELSKRQKLTKSKYHKLR